MFEFKVGKTKTIMTKTKLKTKLFINWLKVMSIGERKALAQNFSFIFKIFNEHYR